MKNSIYLDYASTTPLDPAVLDAMLPYLGSSLNPKPHTLNPGLFGNPGSLHSFGQQASGAVFIARQMIAKELNCHYSEIIFTGSATEANNMALRGAVKEYQRITNKDTNQRIGSDSFVHSAKIRNSLIKPRVIISAIEHESVLNTAKDLEKDDIDVVIVPVSKDGAIDLKKLKAALNDQTVIVSVMQGNNEVGTIQPIAEIAKIVRDFRASRIQPTNRLTGQLTNYPLLHTDAVQAFQYLECDVQKMNVDLMTLSAHKLYGPKGIGALYVRKGYREQGIGYSKNSTLNPEPYPLDPVIIGGGQEFGMRSGTENVAAIVGFAKAVSLVAMDREDEALRVAQLRDTTWQGIKKIFPKAVLNGPSITYNLSPITSLRWLPNNLNFYIPATAGKPGISGEELLVALDLHGVAVSSGSACSARSIDPSHVLLAMGFDKQRAKNSIRISLGRMTTSAEMKLFLNMLRRVKESMG